MNRKSPARHYTIANAMRPEIYKAYLRTLRQEHPFPEELLAEADSNQMAFCVKNYQGSSGLSHVIHEMGPIFSEESIGRLNSKFNWLRANDDGSRLCRTN